MDLSPVRSPFFEMTFKKNDGAFEVRVTPVKRALARPLPPPLYRQSVIFPKTLKRSNHWVILGYDKEPPYIGRAKRYEEGLAFPLDFSYVALPAVGAVDLNGEPVFMKEKKDVETFMAIKSAFRSKKYRKAYELATDAMELYPRSIFSSDFLRYRIKSLVAEDIKKNADEVIKLGRIFIKRYASDEYLPEVLLLLARVYSATGFVSDANYFFNRLIHEHKGSRYADLGLIYLGDQLYINGKVKEAMKRYLQAYYTTKDLDIASLAAYKLAVRNLDQGKTDEALTYLKKIWKKNPAFLLRDKNDAHEIAKQLAARHRYDLAIAIDRALLKKLSKLDELYEPILFEISEWYDEKGDVADAVVWYQRYLDAFAYGKYSDKAKKSLDELFVAGNDANATEALERYDTMIHEYRGQSIGDKAMAAKIALLAAMGRYEQALSLSDKVDEIADPEAKKRAQEALRKAALGALSQAQQHDRCDEAVRVVSRYDIELPKKAWAFVYDCYVRYARYDDALKIAQKGYEKGDRKERADWLCRIAHNLTEKGSAKKALEAYEELKALTKEVGRRCPEMAWDRIRIYHLLGRYADEMAAIKTLSTQAKGDMRLADIYRQGYESARKKGDDVMRRWLLERLIALQNASGSHPYSPWVEFELIKVLKSQKRYDEALKVVESMKSLKLDGKASARWRYELGALYQRLGRREKARQAFEACIKVKNGGAWKQLCEEALSLQ